MKEILKKSELVYDGSFLKVQRDEVELPNGKTTHREYIQHPGASLIIPVFADFETLLIQQYRHPLKKIFWEFPAGKKDAGENALTTAKREFFEETGITAKKWTWITDIHPVIGYADEVIHIFMAENLQQEDKPSSTEEFLEVKKMPFSAVTELVKSQQITDVKTLAAYFWAEKILSGAWKTPEQPRF